MRFRQILSFITLSIVFSITFSIRDFCQEKKEYASMEEAIMSSKVLKGKSGPQNVDWIKNGSCYSYTLRNNATNNDEIREYNPGTLEDNLLLNVDELTVPSSTEKFNYDSYEWSKDSKYIIFKTNFRPIYRNSGISDYYIYSAENKTLKLLVKDARTAELSPDGSIVGYEREGNMYVYYINTGEEQQLTNDASENIYSGHFDWVYEEEFDISQGWSWSPDSKYLAFWQFDESNEPLFQMTNYSGQHPDYVKFRVPLVGDPNARLKIGVINIKEGSIKWLNNNDEYIPRIYWTSEQAQLGVLTLNRKQNDLKLYFYNVDSGKGKLIFEEESNTWIDFYNFYENVSDMIYFPDHLREFFWISDRDGYQHIYRYDYAGNLLNQITKGNWSVTKVEGIDPESQTLFYTSTEVSPLQRHLYSIKFDGTDKHKLSQAEGKHSFNLSPNTKYFIDTYSSTNQPKQVELWNTEGKMLTKLEDNKGVTKYLEDHKYSPNNIFSFTTGDGIKIDGRMTRPFDFDSTKKYPVVFDVYGGPNSQDVFDAFDIYWWNQWLAQEGFIIVDINNRGNANYGRDFMKIVYEHLGKLESNDYVETLNYLSGLSYVDTSNAAIMGTSYGGYITIFTMLTHPGCFKAGIANSAVTDWFLYDDIYTEKYMGLKDENVTGYKESSNVENAGNLLDKLLIIHSAMDDNVHLQNTMQFLTALTDAGKDADLRIYPDGGHGAIYNLESYMLIYKVTDNYLKRYLK